MYQTKGKLNTTALCLFTASDGYASSGMKPECAWRDAAGVIRVGTWIGEWGKIERAWDLDRWGKWKGSPPMLLQVRDLKLLDNDGSEIIPIREGDDPVFYIGSGAGFKVDWTQVSLAIAADPHDGTDSLITIYKTSDGSVARTTALTRLPIAQDTLPDGSYVVYVQYQGVHEGLRLPTGYVRNPDYDYLTGDGRTSHFNPYKFVGEIPADPQHPLNVLRAELVASNTEEDDWHYSAYVTSEAAQNGEGSAIKLHVGAGSWAVAADTFVTPSRPLHELDFSTTAVLPEGTSASTPVPVYIDPMAHVISEVLQTRADGVWGGKILLGGGRLSATSARPSLWQWNDDGTTTLLGSTTEACAPLCEQRMSTGLVTGLQELQDGSIIVLTLCSRHIYDPNGVLQEDRLPRWPLATDGEPGGRSITAIGEGIGTRVLHTTEALGRQPDPLTPSFYNVMVDVQGEKIHYAPGTLCHLDGDLWRHRGKAFGVRCDGDPTDEATREQITFYDGIWNTSAAKWRATWLVLQRGASLNGVNLCFGWVPDAETAQVVRDDGRKVQVLESDYRLREGTLTRHATESHLQSYLAPAHAVVDGAIIDGWALVEFDGSDDNDEWKPPIVDPLDPPGESDDRFYRVLRLPADNPINVLQIRDVMYSQAFLAANADLDETEIGVRVRVDSEADIDDYASYIFRPMLDKGFVLPVAAAVNVEVLVVTRAALAPEQLPVLGVAA